VNTTNKQNEYPVKNIGDQVVKIDGKGTDDLWAQANVLSDFQYPWQTDSAPSTIFKALCNKTDFYFLFTAQDAHIHLAPSTGDDRTDALGSDRVELFFKKDDQMNPYYALEIDPSLRVFDSKGRYYKILEKDWSFPRQHLDLAAHIHEDGYIIEGRISLSVLHELELIEEYKIQIGLFRANYVAGNFQWISWIDPESSTPDFHVPSAFGVFILEQ